MSAMDVVGYIENELRQDVRGAHDLLDIRCIFCGDRFPTMTVNKVNGRYSCFRCGAVGLDMIALHAQRHGLTRRQARDQLRSRSENGDR